MIVNKMMKGLHCTEKWFCIAAFAVMTVVTFLAAVNRFTLNIAMPWSEELVKYLLVWLTMVGAAIGVSTGAHVGIDSLVMLFPKKLQIFIERLMLLVGAAFSVLFCVMGVQLTLKQYAQKSTALEISMGFIYVSLAIGGILMLTEFLYRFYCSVLEKKSEDETEVTDL